MVGVEKIYLNLQIEIKEGDYYENLALQINRRAAEESVGSTMARTQFYFCQARQAHTYQLCV